MELAGQQDNRGQRQQRYCCHAAGARPGRQHRGRVGALQRFCEQRDRPLEHHECHEYADRQERNEFDDGFDGDRQHEAVLMFGGVDMPCTEQDREGGERNRDEQRRVTQRGLHRVGPSGEGGHDRVERGRHGLELKRDVRDHADDGDHRHGRRHALMFAITRADEIRDRDDVLRF